MGAKIDKYFHTTYMTRRLRCSIYSLSLFFIFYFFGCVSLIYVLQPAALDLEKKKKNKKTGKTHSLHNLQGATENMAPISIWTHLLINASTCTFTPRAKLLLRLNSWFVLQLVLSRHILCGFFSPLSLFFFFFHINYWRHRHRLCFVFPWKHNIYISWAH